MVTLALRREAVTLKVVPPLPSLSSDLLIVVFFAITMSTVFILGTRQSIRLIVAGYVSAIAVEGTVIVLKQILGNPGSALESIGIPADPLMIALANIFLFLVCTVLFVTRSGIEVTYERPHGRMTRIAVTALFGFVTAGLFASVIATYGSGGGLGGTLPIPGVTGEQSILLTLLIRNQAIWYVLPAVLILVSGLL